MLGEANDRVEEKKIEMKVIRESLLTAISSCDNEQRRNIEVRAQIQLQISILKTGLLQSAYSRYIPKLLYSFFVAKHGVSQRSLSLILIWVPI